MYLYTITFLDNYVVPTLSIGLLYYRCLQLSYLHHYNNCDYCNHSHAFLSVETRFVIPVYMIAIYWYQIRKTNERSAEEKDRDVK